MVMYKKQSGVVLIVSLVFLVSLTAVVSVIMLNTTADTKMSGAGEQKLIATQEAISAVDETISDQITSGTNNFQGKQFPFEVTTVTSVEVDEINIINRTPTNSTVNCPHTRLASGTEMIECNLLDIVVDKNYGKHSTSNIGVNAGISQEILNVGN